MNKIILKLYNIFYVPIITIINYYKMLIFKNNFPINKLKNIIRNIILKHNIVKKTKSINYNELLEILTIKKDEFTPIYIRPDNPYYDTIYNKHILCEMLDYIPHKHVHIRLYNQPTKREIEQQTIKNIETQRLLDILSLPKLEHVHININYKKSNIDIERLQVLKENIKIIPFPKSFIPKIPYDTKGYDGDYILNDWGLTCKDIIDIFGNPGPLVCNYFATKDEKQYLDKWREDYYKTYPTERPPTKSFKDMLLSQY